MLGKQRERENKTWFEPEQRLKFLLSLLFVLVFLFVFLASNSPEGSTVIAKLRAYRQSMENHRRFQQALASDPPVGTNFKQLALNSFPYASKSPLPLLIVVFGGCEGCGAQSLKDWAEVFDEWKTIRKEIAGVLVIRDKAEKVKEVASKNGWKVEVVADESGEISKSLNAFFSPRAYGFVEGRLVWVQKRVGMGIVDVLEEFLKVVRGEERMKQILNSWSAEMREKAWGKLPGLKGGEKR